MKLAGFVQQSVEVTWQQNARMYASCCCGRYLRTLRFGTTEEKKGATSAGVCGDICHFSYVIFELLNMIMSDSLLSRARACEDGRGLGSSCGEISMRSGAEARHRSFQQKPRSTKIQLQLWKAWSVVLMGGYVAPAWVKHRSSTSWCLKSN